MCSALARVPLIAGVTNAGKRLTMDPRHQCLWSAGHRLLPCAKHHYGIELSCDQPTTAVFCWDKFLARKICGKTAEGTDCARGDL